MNHGQSARYPAKKNEITLALERFDNPIDIMADARISSYPSEIDLQGGAPVR